MAEAAVSFLLEGLKDILIHNVDLISGARNEFQQLTDDLDLLNASVAKLMLKRKEEEGPLREILKQIREGVYEVEDTIDALLTQAYSQNSKNFFRRRLRKWHFSLAKEVNSLRERKLKPIFAAVNAYASDPPTTRVEETRPVVKKVFSSYNYVVVPDDVWTIFSFE